MNSVLFSIFSSSSYIYCDWQSVGQFVLVSGPLFDNYFLLHVGRPLWWEDGSVICSAITHWLESRITIYCCLIWDSSYLEGQVPIFISLRNRVVQLYHRALGNYSWNEAEVSRPVCLGVGLPSGTHTRLQASWCGAPSLTGGWVCNLLIQLLLGLARAVTLVSKSRRTQNHILRFHLRLPQPEGLCPCIYIPQEQGGPVIPPGTGIPFCRLWRLAGLWWRYLTRLHMGHYKTKYLVPISFWSPYIAEKKLYCGPRQTLESWQRYSVDSVLCAFKSNCKVWEMWRGLCILWCFKEYYTKARFS
jgi:hypothetical protein